MTEGVGQREEPMRKKHIAAPTALINNPATDGPTTRAPLTIELLSEIALSKSSRLVISIMNAWRAGMSKAIASPPIAASTMICQTRIWWAATSPANTRAVTIIVV